MNKKVSIIVPIYNQEKYLFRCVNSIINQTYKNIEIILVNDGSNDNSLNICKELQIKDKRVIVIDKPNSGVSDSRNIGIKVSTGDYIGFVDSDDFISENMIEELIKNISDTNADVAICNYSRIDSLNNIISKKEAKYKLEIVEKNELIIGILDETKYKAFCWNKLFKREIIKDIKFNIQRKIGEDLEFIMKVVPKCKKIIYLSQPLYFYFINQNGVTRKKYTDNINKWNGEIELCDELVKQSSKEEYSIYTKKRYCRINMTCYMKLSGESIEKSILKKYRINALKYYYDIIFSKNIKFNFKFKLFIIKYFYYLAPIYSIIRK